MSLVELQSVVPRVQGLLDSQTASKIVLDLIIVALEPIETDSLRYLTRFFVPFDYESLIQERALAGICGYPLCSNKLLDQNGKRRLLRDPKAPVIDLWKTNWCSLRCFQCSEFIRTQISTETLVTRRDVAWAAYGELPYENNLLFLEDMLAVASAENRPVMHIIKEALRRQAEVDEELDRLAVPEAPSEFPNASLAKLSIQESSDADVSMS